MRTTIPIDEVGLNADKQGLSFPKILSGLDSRREAESSHHLRRCLPGLHALWPRENGNLPSTSLAAAECLLLRVPIQPEDLSVRLESC